MKIAIALEKNEFDSKLDERFGRAPYFAVFDLNDMNIENINFLENEFKDENSGAGQKVVLFLKEKGIDSVIVPELGPKAKIALKELEIKAFKKGNSNNLKDIILELKKNTLEEYPLIESILRRI